MPSSPVFVFDSGSNPTTVRKGETTVQRNQPIKRIKATLLVTLAATGGAMFASCGGLNLQDSIAAGTSTFVQGFVADFLADTVPAPSGLLGGE